MPRPSAALLLLLLLVAPPGTARAQGDPAWVRFTDPVESAFTVEIPEGWRVAGGVRRFAPSEAPAWVTAASPDGAQTVFAGDPNVGTFLLPNEPFMSTEGAQVPWLHNRGATVMRYKPGAEYAAAYGARALSAQCTDVRVAGTQPLPQLEDTLRPNVQNATRIDAGAAEFTCRRGGQEMAAGVAAATVLTTFQGGSGGLWQVPVLSGFLAPKGQEADVQAKLDHLLGSFAFDPQFQAAMRRANEQEEAAARAQAAAASSRPAAPAPVAPTPYQPTARPRRCDDLQQERICAISGGRLLSSDGCLRCVSQ